MACTRTLKIALMALVFLTGLLIIDIAGHARERGYSTVAGKSSKSRSQLRSKNLRYKRHRLHANRKHGRSLHDTLFYIDATELAGERNSEEEIRRRSHLREKVSVMRRRSGSKIIRVSEEMKKLGAERAKKRDSKMLSEMHNLDIRYYRDTEAYDARFPSIVYLELLRK